ncbi:MAG: TetR family transcriptional regulator [Rhodococcus sp.]|nr:TetR family transcriptional regulator [Rhodococcus sp. (in: high G+C Gram-positive bacteria)]
MSTQPPPAPGLRERKRLEAMRRIQASALDLFDRFGYRQFTVEQVAADAGVSPSSVYRYFGTKEQLILHDEYDPRILELLRSVDSGATWTVPQMMEILRHGAGLFMSVLGPGDEERVQRRMAYVVSEPEVHAGMVRDAQKQEVEIREIVASRLGRDGSDFEVRVLVAMAVWGFLSGIFHWAESGFTQSLATTISDVFEIVTRPVGSAIDIEQADAD